MKRNILIVLVLLFVTVGVAYADSLLPDDVEQFYDDCGYVCYVWPDGSGDCYPCLECDEPVPPTKEPTREPTKELPPTETPVPPKPKCNRGLGNGSEDCDPGNSGGKPGAAGEDNE